MTCAATWQLGASMRSTDRRFTRVGIWKAFVGMVAEPSKVVRPWEAGTGGSDFPSRRSTPLGQRTSRGAARRGTTVRTYPHGCSASRLVRSMFMILPRLMSICFGGLFQGALLKVAQHGHQGARLPSFRLGDAPGPFSLSCLLVSLQTLPCETFGGPLPSCCFGGFLGSGQTLFRRHVSCRRLPPGARTCVQPQLSLPGLQPESVCSCLH